MFFFFSSYLCPDWRNSSLASSSLVTVKSLYCPSWTLHLLYRPPFLYLSCCLNTSFLPLLPTPASILFIPVFEIKHLTWSREEGWWQVKGIYLFISSLARTACSLCLLSLCSHSSDFLEFPFRFAFCRHNLPHFFFFIPFCFFFLLLLFLLPYPSLSRPHRSGCSCGTRQGKSDFVASSRVTSETLLLLL